MYKFKVESYEFTLHHLLIEKDTFLYGFINWEENQKTEIEEIALEDIDPGNFENFTSYLRGGDFLWNQEISDFFNYMGYSNEQGYPLDYWKVKLRDRWIRNNFYCLELWKEESKKRFNLEIETGPYVGLERAENLFSFIDFQNSIEIMEEFNKIYSFDGFILAGGALITLLMDIPRRIADLDFFIVTQDEKEGNEILREMIISQKYFDKFNLCVSNALLEKVRRTRHAITFIKGGIKEQIILRLYTCPSEVVHGFDLDSCGILYDGEGLWATQRTIYSISRKVNFFDPERMSETYAYRLAKYASKGFRVWLPNFKKERIRRGIFEELINDKKSDKFDAPWDIPPSYLEPSKLGKKVLNHPLDMIIFSQYYRYMPKLQRSDYDKMRHQKGYHQKRIEADLMKLKYREKLIESYEINEDERVEVDYWIYSGSGYVTVCPWDWDNIYSLTMEFILDLLLDLDQVRIEESGLPQKLEWKIQNPMEQLSGTFNPTKDTINEWYKDSYLYRS